MNFKALLCALLEHRYIVELHFSEKVRKVGCTRCPKKWGMNDSIPGFIPWDDQLEEMSRAAYPEVYEKKLD
jgi:hypothetical protein